MVKRSNFSQVVLAFRFTKNQKVVLPCVLKLEILRKFLEIRNFEILSHDISLIAKTYVSDAFFST